MQKYGHVKGVQRYQCRACGRQFLGGERLSDQQIWQEYVEHKQTYSELAQRYGCSTKTIQRHLDKYKVTNQAVPQGCVIVLMDTTYWRRSWGVMLFKDAITNKNLLKYYVQRETVAKYKEGISEIKRLGFFILGIVCDGRRGLFSAFGDIPIQMCQFHQQEIIRAKLTKKPRLQASKDLYSLSLLLTETDKVSFVGALDSWFFKWGKFMNERTVDEETGKSFYTHKRLRSAYNSLRRNLPYLFTYEDNLGVGMPNTTNAIDGHFSELKKKLRCHNGMSEAHKKRFIDEFLSV